MVNGSKALIVRLKSMETGEVQVLKSKQGVGTTSKSLILQTENCSDTLADSDTWYTYLFLVKVIETMGTYQ